MPAARFKDRITTSQVARAITSPLGIILGGAGFAVGVAAGWPIVAAVTLGAVAYSARVAAAIPRGIDADGIDPFTLRDPWRTYVWQARKARRLYADAIKSAKDGPLRERLQEVEDRISRGVEECWRVAQQGQGLADARSRIDIATVTKQLADLHAMNPTPPPAGSSMAQTIDAVQAQLDTAKRLDSVIADTDARLRLLDARLDESVTRAIELSARVGSADDLGVVLSDVEHVVGDLEALRQALGEAESIGSRQGPTHVVAEVGSATAGTPGALPAPDPMLSIPPLPPDARAVAHQVGPPAADNGAIAASSGADADQDLPHQRIVPPPSA